MRQSPGSGTHPLLLELTHSLVKLMNAFAASDASCQERCTMPAFSLRLWSRLKHFFRMLSYNAALTAFLIDLPDKVK